jgi:hypothetical protein
MVEFDEADEEAAGAAALIEEVYEGRSSMDENTCDLGVIGPSLIPMACN